MSAEAKERAEVVAAIPRVKAWVNRFRKLSKEMPPEIWVYVASGTPTVMAYGENRKWFSLPNDGSDQDAIIDHVSGGSWDGGDW